MVLPRSTHFLLLRYASRRLFHLAHSQYGGGGSNWQGHLPRRGNAFLSDKLAIRRPNTTTVARAPAWCFPVPFALAVPVSLLFLVHVVRKFRTLRPAKRQQRNKPKIGNSTKNTKNGKVVLCVVQASLFAGEPLKNPHKYHHTLTLLTRTSEAGGICFQPICKPLGLHLTRL